MAIPTFLPPLLQPGRAAKPLAPDIWTVMPAGTARQVYDRHAALYDRLIGSPLYNRIAWGTSPASYAAFAQEAVAAGEGVLLDGGCGSLVSTVEVHVRSGRLTVLCDLSEGMLQAARDRIIAMAGRVPDHLVLLQADLLDLPFANGAFASVLCPGMLHIFDDLAALTRELARVAAPDAPLHMSSLVAERWIGKRYLNLLHRAGEVAKPRGAAALLDRLNAPDSDLRTPVDARREGSMVFVRAQKRP